MPTKKIRVCFVLPSLGAGGAERVMSFVSQNIDKDRFSSTLLITGLEKDTQYNIEGIDVVYLNQDRVSRSIPKLFSFFRKNKQEVVISAIGHLNTVMGLFAIFFRKTKFIGREVNVLSVLKNYPQSNKGMGSSYLTKFSYKFLDKIICQSNDMYADIKKVYSVNPSKLVIINNPITENFVPKANILQKDDHIYQFITIGRLAKQKGHPRILHALAKLRFPFHYTIIGSGPEKENIIELIDELDLSSKITHIPFTNEVPKYLKNSDVFLQGSYVEGFPNALLESCAVGTPVVAFKALGGIDEIILDGVNGFIVDDIDDFANKIHEVVNSPQNWNPQTISDSVYNRYSQNIILSKYEDLLLEVSSPQNKNT